MLDIVRQQLCNWYNISEFVDLQDLLDAAKYSDMFVFICNRKNRLAMKFVFNVVFNARS